MITIAVTGGIGAGKSETVNILERLGALTISADRLGHAAYAKGTTGHTELVKAFGDRIVRSDGEIDRKIVGDIVFADESKRKKLESIVWHRIRDMVQSQLAANADCGTAVTVIEAAVLFEAGWEDLADAVWTVEATYHQRLGRLIAASGMDEQTVRKRMQAQLDAETRIKRSNEVIRNNGDLEALGRRVTELWEATINT